MLDDLWVLRGAVALDSADDSVVALGRVQRLLEEEKMRVAERRAGAVFYEAPLWDWVVRNRRWGVFSIYDRGRVWIDGDATGRALRYEFRSFQTLATSAACVAAIGVFAFAGVGPRANGTFVAVVVACLYAMHVVWANLRVPRLIRDAVRPT
jgi:hypothetical protein